MELWIAITIAAAFFQNIRSTFQRYLKDRISTSAATFVRFGFGIPFAFFYLAIFLWVTGDRLPSVEDRFWVWASIAGVAQILATALLLATFSYRNFTVGTAYSRTEPAQTALFALVLFGEQLGVAGIFAIAISISGVMLISVARTEITLRSLFTSLGTTPALLGLGSGTLFGLAAVGYREAALSVNHDLSFMKGVVTLCFAITLQSMIMLAWIMVRERHQLKAILKAWKPALLVGFVGATASFGWFTAFTLQQAALVKVVAQIEMLFTFASSVFFFRETLNRPEIIGCLLITAGIIVLVLAG
ncbi:MAG: DMT family transporter [Pseudomonadota bacterium]